MSKIGVVIKNREVAENGVVHVTVSMMHSTKDMLKSIELPTLLNAIRHSELMNKETQVGFDYVLGFPMKGGFGFPYALDAELLDETDRNLI